MWKRRNNNSNDIRAPKLIRNEVSHKILIPLCQKLQIQNGEADFVFTST